MTTLEKFLHDVSEIHASHAAVDETPYYGSLETLFNEIGKTLKPRVRCIIHIKNRGAGLPDGGLFTAEQFNKKSSGQPKEGQLPSRGAIEVKPPREDATGVALGKQSTRYLARYRQVLITNLREFILVGHDLDGNPAILERYELADSEANFWKAAAHPRKTDEVHGARFAEYLMRVMLHAAPLAAPEDVAFFLASYARDALARIEGIDLDALAAIRSALEEALGLKFEGKKGEHFFHSSLIQTLFYGVFSAWVLWARKHPSAAKERFDWNATARLLRVPVIRKLFHEVADPGQLEELNLAEVLDWTAAVLNRVDRAQFFTRFQESHAVQYFYEPFLEEFDPELRKQLGVWYTPPEIVEYMVARVDTVLREELDLPDGLADPNVYVLDPCCGTGSFLVEVLRKIHDTLKARGEDALVASDLAEAAQNRIFGFEILPAPFVVSHLQIGLLLDQLGAPLGDAKNDRAAVYLTNALTGWEPPKGPKKQLPFAEFGEERDAAEKVKRDTPILVVLGNPPYNALAGVSATDEEIELIAPYKLGLIKEWGIKKFNLDDLYVRFFRLAEHRIAEMTGRGVVSFISNHSWINEPSFVVLRRHLLSSFDKFWVENMHGNRKISEYAPDGRVSETVFAIPGLSVGIRQGVAISLWVKNNQNKGQPEIRFRDDLTAARASERRAQLLESLNDKHSGSHYQLAQPSNKNRYSFQPSKVTPQYRSWPSMVELCHNPPQNGLMEKRRGALLDVDRDALEGRMQAYYNPEVDWDALSSLPTGLTKNAARYNAKKARSKVLAAEEFDPKRLRRYALRPFDTRWCYYTPVRPLWNEPRPVLWEQAREPNAFLMSRPAGVAKPEGAPVFFTRCLGDNDFLRGHAYYFPLRLRIFAAAPAQSSRRQQSLLAGAPEFVDIENLSEATRHYLGQIGVRDAENEPDTATKVWMHVIALAYSPTYLSENRDGVREGWPRVPLPNSRELLQVSSELGRRIAVLLDTETTVEGVSIGDPRQQTKLLALPSRKGGGSLTGDELAVTIGWGHADRKGTVTPGRGRLIVRDYTEAEREEIATRAKSLSMTAEQAFTLLGSKTFDIYLSDTAYWANVPAKVWEYTIGGYQVIKKWLSYREKKLLGRPLTKDEVRYVQEMVRRIAAIILLEPALDANYKTVKTNAFPWMP
jgi:hypothetical protein